MSETTTAPPPLAAVETQAANLAMASAATVMAAPAGTEPSWAKPAVAVLSLLIFAGMLVYAYATHDESTKQLLAGGAMGMASTAVSYYLGSSAGSATKTALLAAAPPVPGRPTA
jgi:ABC-type cobalamin transport system permease subunit